MTSHVLLLVGALAGVACASESGRRTSGYVAAAATEAPEPEVRRIAARHWSDRDAATLAVAPDGRALLHEDASGALVLRDVSGGSERMIAPGQRGYVERGAYFSRDGSRLAYVLAGNGAADYELRVVRVADGRSATLARSGEQLLYMRVLDWSPDGSEILVLRGNPDFTGTLARVSADDGTSRPIRTFDWRAPSAALFSKSGRYIAYSRRTGEQRGDVDIFVMPVAGGTELRLSDDGGRKTLLGWSADDRSVLYAAHSRDGSTAILRAAMNGDARGAVPQLIRSDLWGFGSRGLVGKDLYYTSRRTRPDAAEGVFELPVDLDRGVASGEPIRLTDPADGAGAPRAMGGAYSPDGSRVAYIVRATLPEVAIRTLAGGEPLYLVPSMDNVTALAWEPSGRALVLTGTSRGRAGVFRYDLEAGTLRHSLDITGGIANGTFVMDVSADAAAAFVRHGRRPDTRLVARPLTGGADRPIALDPRVTAISPRGDRGAYEAAGEVVIVSADRSSPPVRVRIPLVGSQPVRVNPFSFAWTSDGRHLLFATRTVEAPAPDAPARPFRQQIVAVPVAGGEPRVLWSTTSMSQAIRDLDVHPGGRRLLFNGGGDPETVVELWVMRGIAAASGSSDGRGDR